MIIITATIKLMSNIAVSALSCKPRHKAKDSSDTVISGEVTNF